MEVEATYENGTLKLERPLPLAEKQRVKVTVHAPVSRTKRLYGLLRWTGPAAELEYLARSPENHPWEAP